METLREIYWEAKRAPSTNVTMLRNPYRRQFLIKKLYGQTAEQRKEKRKELKAFSKKFYKDFAEAEMAEEL